MNIFFDHVAALKQRLQTETGSNPVSISLNNVEVPLLIAGLELLTLELDEHQRQQQQGRQTPQESTAQD